MPRGLGRRRALSGRARPGHRIGRCRRDAGRAVVQFRAHQYPGAWPRWRRIGCAGSGRPGLRKADPLKGPADRDGRGFHPARTTGGRRVRRPGDARCRPGRERCRRRHHFARDRRARLPRRACRRWRCRPRGDHAAPCHGRRIAAGGRAGRGQQSATRSLARRELAKPCPRRESSNRHLPDIGESRPTAKLRLEPNPPAKRQSMHHNENYLGVSRFALGAAALCLIGKAFLPQAAIAAGTPASPIEHLVVIFQENVSFDHYFGTYPTALNPPGEPSFMAAPATPSVNGLGTLIDGEPDGVLLTDNPNARNPANAPTAINPFRLDRLQAPTCDQDHSYGDEQKAFDQGLMDLFPGSVGAGSCGGGAFAYGKGKGLVMGYFDGNTVTALWNYAQNFAMSDNSYGTTFGPSTPGLLNLVAGNTYPATPSAPSTKVVPINAGPGTLVGDLDPAGDVCSAGTTVQLGGPNIGDLLNAKGVSWGAFMGGFDLSATNANGTTGCGRSSLASASNAAPGTPPNLNTTKDYIPHHAFLQYYASTANPQHLRPSSVAVIGTP